MNHLLIVEDEPEILELFITIFEMEGWTVTAATDGLHALNLLNNYKHFDVVLSDNMMPRMSGLELLERLDKPEIPVWIHSGDLTITDRALELGAAGVIPKPSSPYSIFEALNSSMDKIKQVA